MPEQGQITVPHLKTPKSSVVDGSEERIDRAREIQRGLERRMERRKSQYEVLVANQVHPGRVTIPEYIYFRFGNKRKATATWSCCSAADPNVTPIS